MGACGSKTEEEKALAKRNKASDDVLKRAKKDKNKKIKVLLLGAGESGKSTFAKQMRLLYADPYSEAELEEITATLHANTLTCMKTLVLAARHFEYEVGEDVAEHAAKFMALNPRTDGVLTRSWVRRIKLLWKDRGIQKTYSRRNEFQFMDSGKYFFKNMSRFVADDFEPSEEDVVRARTRTTGIVESTFSVQDHTFQLVDVGGQRSERRRWMHTFDDVTSVLFFAALTEYDQVLYEDAKRNRMEESMDLFGEMSSSSWFNRTAFILFLNKLDLFEEKIARTDLSVLFPDWDGGHDFEGGMDFIKEKYLERCTRKGAKIFTHFTTATNKENITVVFNKCREVIISQNLERLGFGRL